MTRTDTETPRPGPSAVRAPRRPVDLLVGACGLGAIAVTLLVVGAATDGDVDSTGLRSLLPTGPLFLAALGANLALILLVCYSTLRILFGGAPRDLLRVSVAAVTAYALTSLINELLFSLIGSDELVPGIPLPPRDLFTGAALGYVAAALAFGLTMPAGQPRVRSLLWTASGTAAVCALLAGVTSPLALVLTVMIGVTCAVLVRYAVGEAAAPPADGRLTTELRRFGLDPVGVSPDGNDAEGDPRHLVELADGRRVEAIVLASENTAGFWRRLRDLVLLRGPFAPRILYGVRRRAEHAALMGHAVRDAGVATPRILAVGELGPGTVLLVRELPEILPVDDLADGDLTDDLLDRFWEALRRIHRHRISHGDLHGATVGVGRGTGEAVLTGVGRGAVAAPPLTVSLDNAALVALLATRVGAERAVASAVRALGVPATAAILPFLQPPGLPYPLRRALRADKELMGRVRNAITEVAPEAPVETARVERMRPRAVVSGIVATVVGLVLLYQLAGVNLSSVGQADPGWALAALAMATLCMVAAAMVLMGFTPLRLPWWRTVMVQYAASFVRIAAPAGLGSIAINTRFVVKAGAPTSLALSAVGLTQLVGFLVHVPLLLVCAYLTGASYWTGFTPSPTVVIISIAVTLVVAFVLLSPRLRGAIADRARPYLRGVLPRLLDTLQRPRALALGLGGTLLLTVAFVLCLYFSVLAFTPTSLQVSLVAVAVVFLAGNAIGSAAPTPGGLGAVEAALIGGLTAVAGVPTPMALSAVLLFRVLTFWLPVLPGWGAFAYLQRREAL
ncbi:lysylphosphatidylglycerol synthase transmembrane domain-containing protein [Nocardiopsis lambiniae]|uniref:Lysylphosphatidylglycerol synthase transmembrane domain-containing protein n=1 Tax=Nocardiopsis lambiniae TaxID=3075539 RepID=A0ABU2MEP5_9ACTN|nr:lysylphosphatidylglycerol synthase transmembrane domain-containing protein [Nocardiopsis sp. DSM 44743]MDT0331155.1 lysylphosphatidylglycerol synthase transmembrane domain-containing protein [Nocardiopsis sp. DSM 44743]